MRPGLGSFLVALAGCGPLPTATVVTETACPFVEVRIACPDLDAPPSTAHGSHTSPRALAEYDQRAYRAWSACRAATDAWAAEWATWRECAQPDE